ncbi:polyprenyl synthetase family protein [Polyangium sp. 6x1]|uniref:polyprenyl synthetase family protein n=1 Tax=Polyangium sp. 6x1 TaxID=3042689 RepID=UPI00248322FB|nr:polyprenyl synthetase family protein [Polyangium sp. 6x1]MDI1443535.1 polyprenyl synthetase family protein [Polyangium sp. 6x1]
MRASDLVDYLHECRALTLAELEAMISRETACRGVLYERMLEYPMRSAKALRPAICIATCRALGGRLEAALPSAAVLELYHNAFLIHDDVEDGSERRRDKPTLHGVYGVPIAVNVGDAMLAFALGPLLDNTRTLGVGKALRILEVVHRMAKESAEGQAIELEWIREGAFDLDDADYVRMVEKKTGHYSFIAPVQIGGIIAGGQAARLDALARFAAALGVAFQIQDDVLNLTADEGRYGKEIGGDLWEGKHTLILMHAMRSAPEEERARARAILRKKRPPYAGASPWPSEALKSEDDVAFLLALIRRHGSVAHAQGEARRRAGEAVTALAAAQSGLGPSVHLDFLSGLVDYVIDRDR